MTYQEKVDYLKSYKDKKYRLLFLEHQLEGIQSINYTDDKSGLHKGINDYLDEKILIEKEMREIRLCINQIQNERVRYILDYRFIHFKSLEEISNIMGYSLAWVKKNYKKGINCIPK